MKAGWAVAGTVMAAGGVLAGLGLVIAKSLTAPASGRTFDLVIRDVDDSGERPIVVLDRTPRTAAPGLYCLIAENGAWFRLSHDVVDRGPHLVGREVMGDLSQGLTAGDRVSWSGIVFSSPEKADLQSTDVKVQTDVGSAPAWLITARGGPSTSWAVHVHGLGSSRSGTLRGVQVASEVGLTSLVVTYRNDGDGPTVGSGRSELGVSEVDDVREAVRFARENGARSVVLFGWSMGASIALQLAADPELRGVVTGLVLESPVLDWVATIRANCERSGLPAWTVVLALPWLNGRRLAHLTGLASPLDLRRFDWIARADELSLPTLILHGALDNSSPIQLSTQLRKLRPDVVDLKVFEADHTMSWNSDCERWRAVLHSWLISQAAFG
jgi:pimeloyl-ACP methyl ester carboxylesterase